MSTASAEPSATSTESAKPSMAHAGEAVVAAHLGFPSAANAAEGAAITTGILTLKTLRTEAFSRWSSSSARLSAAEPFRATPDCRISAESRGAAETARHGSIGIRNT
jgi:hypothetical protein